MNLIHEDKMTVTRIALSLLLGAASLEAQTPLVAGVFVSTLGNDTIAVERYTRSGEKLEGDLLYRTPRVRIVHYVADLTADRKFKGLAVTTRRVGTDPTVPPLFSMTTLIADSTATVDVQRNGQPDTVATGKRAFKGPVAPSIPGVPPALGLYEQILAFNPLPATDSVVIATPGAIARSTVALSRRGRAVQFSSSFNQGWIEIVSVDANGRITGSDATATTVKTISRRADSVDFDALAKRWASLEAAAGTPTRLSVPDTLRTTIGAARIEVSYSRPSRRGRVIFGSVVPWNQVWRTGADAATQLSTSADLMFGNTLVPAGKYTLWTIPSPNGAKLIVNRQTGQWGTEYDVTRDLTRLDLARSRLPQPVEQFSIAVLPRRRGGLLRMQWENTEYSIPFRLK